MDKFKVGDMVRIIKGPRAGRNAQVLEHRVLADFHLLSGEVIVDALTYRLDIDGWGTASERIGFYLAAPEDWLAPLYDGYEKTTWEDCVWRPKVLEKV